MQAGHVARSGLRHALLAIGEAAIVAIILATIFLALSPVYRPAGTLSGTTGVDAGNRGTISVPNGVFAGTTTGTVNPGGSDIWAMAECYQNGTLVYRQFVESGADSTAMFKLGPTPLWQGGAAACKAFEGYWSHSGRWRTIASTTFNVSG